MARSHRTVKAHYVIYVDGVKITVLGGRSTLQIHSKTEPEIKIKTPRRKNKLDKG